MKLPKAKIINSEKYKAGLSIFGKKTAKLKLCMIAVTRLCEE